MSLSLPRIVPLTLLASCAWIPGSEHCERLENIFGAEDCEFVETDSGGLDDSGDSDTAGDTESSDTAQPAETGDSATSDSATSDSATGDSDSDTGSP